MISPPNDKLVDGMLDLLKVQNQFDESYSLEVSNYRRHRISSSNRKYSRKLKQLRKPNSVTLTSRTGIATKRFPNPDFKAPQFMATMVETLETEENIREDVGNLKVHENDHGSIGLLK